MPQQMYENSLLERKQYNYRWETDIASEYSIDDLDTEEIFRTMRIGAENGRLPEYQGDSIPLILDRLGVRKGEKLLNAAIVLFGKQFLPSFTQCQLRLARFQGTDKSEFIDQNQIYGNAFYLLEQALIFLRRHLPVSGKIPSDSVERKDELLFPLPALREALVNAFCHRLYTHPGGAVSLAIFDDRLEIWNDGTLPFGLTLHDLKIDHISQPRNPVIANVFYYRGLIEKWGRGTQKIINLCMHAGRPEPEFFEQASSFVVRFLSHKYIAPRKVPHHLTDRQINILNLLSESNEGLAFSEIKKLLPNPPADRTLRDDFQNLKLLHLVETKGFGRSARWFLKNNE